MNIPGNFLPYAVTALIIIAAINGYMIFARRKKKKGLLKEAKEGRMATEKRHEDLKRKLVHEQEYLVKYVELQNRMFELFEQVRNQSRAEPAASDQTEAEADPEVSE